MRRFVWLVLPAILAGCAGMPALSTLAYLIDGASFVGTGKTVGDHALSVAAQEDCAILRFTFGEPICRPEEEEEAIRAANAGARPPAVGTASAPMAKKQRSWPVAALAPEPLGAAPARSVDFAVQRDPGLLEFSAPTELLAEQPCLGGDCALPPLWGDG